MELAQARKARIVPRTGGRALADSLVAQGIDHVFAVPAVPPPVDASNRSSTALLRAVLFSIVLPDDIESTSIPSAELFRATFPLSVFPMAFTRWNPSPPLRLAELFDTVLDWKLNNTNPSVPFLAAELPTRVLALTEMK